MQTFSRSRSFSWISPRRRVLGFTLVELLISIAIITVISAIVVVRFRAFDSTVLLKNLAYEMAMSIRDAQVHAVSVINTSGTIGGYRTPYGVSFIKNAQSYSFCRYMGTAAVPFCEGDGDDVKSSYVNTFTLNQNMRIFELCIVDAGGTDCSLSRLDVFFKRPEFRAYFHDGSPVAGAERALIKVKAISDDTAVWVIDVGVLGQVSVYKE